MNFDSYQRRASKPNERRSNSNTRSRPLEYIFHNPILKSLRRAENSCMPNREVRNISVKVLDLKLPTIARPMLKSFLNNCSKVFRAQKSNTRSRSIMSQLYIDSTTQ